MNNYKNLFKEKREETLEALDNNLLVSNYELIDLELTPYLKRSENSSFFEEIFIMNSQSEKFEHCKTEAKSIFLFPEQKRKFEEIQNSTGHIIFSAPTSFGKTMLLKEYIYRSKISKVAIIVPTNSLSYELERDLSQNDKFEEYTIFDSRKSDIGFHLEKFIFIGTQEKFLEISKEITELDLVVIDEAYKLGDKIDDQRNYILSTALIDSIENKGSKMVLLSPNAIFKNFDKFEKIETEFNIVGKTFILVENEEKLLEIVGQKEKLNEKSIIFISNPNDAIVLWEKINNKFIKSPEKLLKDLIEQIKVDFHEDWIMVKYLEKNVLLHHGKMPRYLQNKIIKLFLDKNLNINTLVGTNSISEGINTPTRNMFFHPSFKTKNKEMLIKNTIGRAGRLGEFAVGKIFSVEDIKSIVENPITIELKYLEDEEFEKEKRNEKLRKLCEDYSFDYDFIDALLKNNHWKITTFIKFLNQISVDLPFASYQNIIKISDKIFRPPFTDDGPYKAAVKRSFLLKSLMQTKSWKNGDKNDLIYHYSYQGKIDAYKNEVSIYNEKKERFDERIEISSNSEIINEIINMQFSTLEYNYVPIANVFGELYKKYQKIQLGNFVAETMADFDSRYRSVVLKRDDWDDLSENSKKVISKLRDFGIPTNSSLLTKEMLERITDQLPDYYNMNKLRSKIEELSFDGKDSIKFKNILNKYF